MVDADIAKDSSTELTVIEKIIDFASNILSARHIPMPESLVVEAMCLNKTTSSKINVENFKGDHVFGNHHFSPPYQVDNTCREGKNQICAKWSATAVAGGKLLICE